MSPIHPSPSPLVAKPLSYLFCTMVCAAALAMTGCVGGSANPLTAMLPDLESEKQQDEVISVRPSRAFGGLPAPTTLRWDEGTWLAGDLHVHTNYSTDASSRPFSAVLETAKAKGLDFLGITDHDNHVNGDVAGNTWADPAFASNEELTLLYGAEWTTGKGHGNTFSAKPYNHQALYELRDGLSTEVFEVVKAEGFHLSANHPSGGDPWGFGYDIVRSIEVWNSSVWFLNANAQTIWDDQIRTGRRMTGRGGSDSHHGYPEFSFGGFNPMAFSPNSFQPFANGLGTPTTWVRSKDRSAEAIIDALNASRVSISATPTSPRLVLLAASIESGEIDLGIGDNLKVDEDRPIRMVVRLEHLAPSLAAYQAAIIQDGAELTQLFFAPGQTEATFVHRPGARRTYYRATLQGVPSFDPDAPAAVIPSLPMVALSNPIYINYED